MGLEEENGPLLRRRLRAAWDHPLMGYPVAVLGELLAVAISDTLQTRWPDLLPYPDVLVVAVVVVVSLRWNFWPSLLAIVVGAALADVYLLPLNGRWSRESGFLTLVVVGLAIGVLGHREVHARRAAEEALRLRNRMLGLATHDLRTPLTLALGYAQLLQNALDQGRLEDLGRLGRHVSALTEALWRMEGMLAELADLARLHMGRALELHPEELDLGALAQTVAAEYGLAKEGAVQVRGPPEPVRVQADRARLARAVDNVVANAVKYSASDAPVEVEVGREDGWATVRVRDRGVGIPPGELRRIFRPFYRASTAWGQPGSGLGLAEVQAIVQQHGGRVEVESTPGFGTTVCISLPLVGH